MIEHVAQARLPTRYGSFIVHAFVDDEGKEHLALVRCEHKKHGGIPLRIHSRCLTGDTLASKRCDCRAQLEASMKYLEKRKCGMLIYLDQEGRGIGLANKIKAYALQDQGMDTVEANVHLGFDMDQRDFKAAVEILRYFGVDDVAPLTNNPKKIKELEDSGIKVSERIPLLTRPNRHNKGYLATKREKMHHML